MGAGAGGIGAGAMAVAFASDELVFEHALGAAAVIVTLVGVAAASIPAVAFGLGGGAQYSFENGLIPE